MVDELAYAGPEHLDPGFVEGYDRKQGHPSFDGDLQVLRERGALAQESTVVDLATGTGRFALAAAAHCRRVVAVDVSAPCWDTSALLPPGPGPPPSSACGPAS